MKVLAFSVVVVALMLIHEGDADCCWPGLRLQVKVDDPGAKLSACKDCTKPTPYCGYGPCNVFGCNCDGGCRQGNCWIENYYTSPLDPATEQQTAENLIIRADANGDNRITPEEASNYMARVYQLEAKEEIQTLDKNGDGFLSLDEIDS